MSCILCTPPAYIILDKSYYIFPGAALEMRMSSLKDIHQMASLLSLTLPTKIKNLVGQIFELVKRVSAADVFHFRKFQH